LTISGTKGSDPVIGEYYVKAINRFGNREAEATSNVITLPGPDVPVITKDLQTGVIENVDDGYTLSVECATAAHSIDTYTWKKSSTKNGTFDKIEDATGSEHTVTEAGFYKVAIDSEVNLATETKESSIVRVTNLPVAVTFSEDKSFGARELYMRTTLGETSIDLALDVTAPQKGDLTSDEVEYRWYIDDDGNGVVEDNNLKEGLVEITETGNEGHPSISGLEGLNKDTNIRCVATNILNNRKTLTQSVLFVIDTPAG
jgi:hypothetical protein